MCFNSFNYISCINNCVITKENIQTIIVVIPNGDNNSVNWGPDTNTVVEYKKIKENEIEDEENKEFYFGEYSPLKQFYMILGPSYGKETNHGIFQMNKNKDYFESDEDKMKLAETYLVQKSLDCYKKNGYYLNGILSIRCSKIVWAVSLDRLNEYFDQFFGIQLSEEAFNAYVEKNQQSGYNVEKGILVFSISSNLTYTYCPVIVEKQSKW